MAGWKEQQKRELRKTKGWVEVALDEGNVKHRWKEDRELDEERLEHDEELGLMDRSIGGLKEKH